jgi:RimJ/RimL family protein N-acetyltransferase
VEHTLQAEGFGVRLRPVRVDDAAFIVWLRHLDHVRGNLNDSPSDLPGQQAWLEEYLLRSGDYYFIIETPRTIALGTFGIYNLAAAAAEAGRWVLVPHVPAAVPSAMVACHLAFDILALRYVWSEVVATNRLVISLDQKLGFRPTHVKPGAAVISGRPVDLVNLVYEAKDWPATRERLLPAALAAEKRILAWEEHHRAGPDTLGHPMSGPTP